MARCCELARQGLGHVSPNPLVGAVVVAEGRIIGEGYHQRYGSPHGEVEAIRRVEDKELLKKATLYVNLEPCCHHGKTPPCTTLIQEVGIPRVVFGVKDPNPLVSGRGSQILNEAGISVTGEVLTSTCRHLNRRFFTNIEKNRPYIILKWAETGDGFIARPDFSSQWISCEASRKLVHQWRAEEDAILVGTTTTVKDNPQLSVRSVAGRNPTRVILDRKGVIPSTHHIYDGSQKTILISELKPTATTVEWIAYPKSTSQVEWWGLLLTKLFENKIGSLIVEGGSQVLHGLIETGLWDEARVFRSEQLFHDGIAAPRLPEEQLAARKHVSTLSGTDRLDIYEPIANHS
jgi:diaminohydroxyphosphoribosylaminopyrimidine deaminase/5-amino-6-(5-phosphoribosylamino)uracil reductase